MLSVKPSIANIDYILSRPKLVSNKGLYIRKQETFTEDFMASVPISKNNAVIFNTENDPIYHQIHPKSPIYYMCLLGFYREDEVIGASISVFNSKKGK